MRYTGFLIYLLFNISINTSYGQSSIDSSVAEVSEILIPQCEKIKHQKNLYYEVYTSQDYFPLPAYWYKILFVKDCSFHFSLFPLYEEDTYDLFCFKLESDMDICNAITNKKLISCNAQRVYKDYNDDEVKTKAESKFLDVSEVKVKAGDAIYIEILSTSGKDCGHILEFKTGLSFFVSKLINRKCPAPENYSSDVTIPIKKYQTIQTEEAAIIVLSNTFCKIKKGELMVTSIKTENHTATFTPGLDFTSYARKKEKPLPEIKTPPVTTKAVVSTNAKTKKDSVTVIKKPTSTVQQTSIVKSTADLEEPSATDKDKLNLGSINKLRHSRLLADKVLFSTLLGEMEGKIEENEKRIDSYGKQLKKADTKEEKTKITASVKQVKQQNLDLKGKIKEVKIKLKTIQKLLDQSEQKKN
jgi:hypothetical protein